ncbi:hypothetical protein GCM10010112_57610 [Actinoplanes lobatus]|uniref:Uncharacterized protein n=1 Tax=Actinoplanes lobatus TaxID=113568 RepID=A0A7W7HCB8_9ACTN|nr:hypothetical protein [Actinoplanes lobatus]MBB4747920.1 hypothetical protein [Actinoplanes lobatus]GGN81306.1 hypothetical protein GCM10010112_57610 [Actinoplanes lobatus]GIE41613.1 hypothetical protein Alo02nite_45110 [Actinoplanes lobatus]
MPARLDEMFTALSVDADGTPMPLAAEVRGRENRRGRTRAVVAGVALAAAFAGGAFLVQRPASPPAPLPVATMPLAIPDSVFLQPEEIRESRYPKDSEVAMLPSLCGADLDAAGRIGLRRQEHIVYRNLTTPMNRSFDAYVEQTVTVFEGDGAERYMEALRSAVASCPGETITDHLPRGPRSTPVPSAELRYRMLAPVGVGDDALLIEQIEPLIAQSTNREIKATDRIAAFRVGDTVVTMDFNATQITPVVDEANMERLIRAAHRRLVDWR